MQNIEENNREADAGSEEEPGELARETEELMEWQEKGWKTLDKEETPEAKEKPEGREDWGEELEPYENASPDIKQDVQSAIDEAYKIEQEINRAIEGGEADELSQEEILKIAEVNEGKLEETARETEGYSEKLSSEEGLSDQEFADLHDRVYPEAPHTDITNEEALNSNEAYMEQPSEAERTERSAQEIGGERIERWASAAKRFFKKGAALFALMVLTRNAYRAVKEPMVRGAENLRMAGYDKLESAATTGKMWAFRNEMSVLTKEQGPSIEKMQQGYDLIQKINEMSPEARERKGFQALHREAARMIEEGRNEVNKIQGKLEEAKKGWIEFLGQDTNMSVAIRGIKARKAARGTKA